MGNKLKQKELFYDDYAHNFWQSVYKSNQETLLKSIKGHPFENKLKNIHKMAMQINELSFKDGSLKKMLIEWGFYESKYLPWAKIEATLRDLKMSNFEIHLAVFYLKPKDIEKSIGIKREPISDVFNEGHKKLCDHFNKEIRNLSPLVKKLKNLSDNDESFKNFIPLYSTIAAIQDTINFKRAIIKVKREEDRRKFKIYGIDENINKSPQKHKYWNIVVSRTIEVINKKCHTDDCERDINGSLNFSCKKIHEKAYKKVAQLLKILYPSIWKEDIYTISNRIKQKNYRNLPR